VKLCRLAVASLVMAMTGLTAPALARPHLSFTIYKAEYEGSGSYKVTQRDGPSHGDIEAHFNWDVTYMLDINHKAGAQVAGFAGNGNSKGSGDWSISSDNGGGDVCTKHGGLKIAPNGAIDGKVQPSGKVAMRVVPGGGTIGEDYTTTGGSSGSQACDTTNFWHDWVESFSHIGTSDNEDIDPLTAFVNLTRSDQRAGKVIFNVSNKLQLALTPNPDCGSGDGATCTQSFDWSGHVTLTKKKSVTY
jgi:hypothetical protein